MAQKRSIFLLNRPLRFMRSAKKLLSFIDSLIDNISKQGAAYLRQPVNVMTKFVPKVCFVSRYFQFNVKSIDSAVLFAS